MPCSATTQQSMQARNQHHCDKFYEMFLEAQYEQERDSEGFSEDVSMRSVNESSSCDEEGLISTNHPSGITNDDDIQSSLPKVPPLVKLLHFVKWLPQIDKGIEVIQSIIEESCQDAKRLALHAEKTRKLSSAATRPVQPTAAQNPTAEPNTVKDGSSLAHGFRRILVLVYVVICAALILAFLCKITGPITITLQLF
ncbi:hypothetical protein M408DRAFT_23852 [Serendipita vermifera MAFF 305830]|uniref:Uncharacterized protein n=1 Tax=Serendipita vermifera MAFF 305830 TaxID=933852 RepID=A0A0C3B9N9_SERVB|nr:hypothetical protein M408DRAFT_23852 [Serendipita vermifera MAFF 305830]